MIWKISIICFVTSLAIMDQYAVGQDEDQAKIPISILNDTKADQIIENLEKIIEQNDNSSRSGVISSYIGMMAFLVGLALVIFGLQMSRSDRLTPVAKKYYKILILALILPVIGLLLYGFVTLGATHSNYLGVAALLMIPAGSVLILMIRRTHEKL
jgi:vacuolar-type H+-ATPase subunit I/STV1